MYFISFCHNSFAEIKPAFYKIYTNMDDVN